MKIRNHGIAKMHYTKALPCPICGSKPEYGWFERRVGISYIELAVVRCPKHQDIKSVIMDRAQRNDITRKALIRNWNGMANSYTGNEVLPFRRVFAGNKNKIVATLAR